MTDHVSAYLSIDSLWFGGVPSATGDWLWLAHDQTFEKFDNWKSDPECEIEGCDEGMGLVALPFDSYKWVKENKSKELPYACVHNCKNGFKWSFDLHKCLKIVGESKNFPSAALECSKDGGQLVSLSSCKEMDHLGNLLVFESYLHAMLP